jgi:hypothetical protein
MENADPPPRTVLVWKNEEKGSDVNLAVHVLNDAWKALSDLAESLHLVKMHHPIQIGLVTPGAPKRKTSRQL